MKVQDLKQGRPSMMDEAIAKGRSSTRGHPIIWTGFIWVYEDNRLPIDSEIRPCRKCGSTKSSSDGDVDECLGVLPGVTNACCGHGDPSTAYICFKGGVVITDFEVREPAPPTEQGQSDE